VFLSIYHLVSWINIKNINLFRNISIYIFFDNPEGIKKYKYILYERFR
jgi:hypothetical protein